MVSRLNSKLRKMEFVMGRMNNASLHILESVRIPVAAVNKFSCAIIKKELSKAIIDGGYLCSKKNLNDYKNGFAVIDAEVQGSSIYLVAVSYHNLFIGNNYSIRFMLYDDFIDFDEFVFVGSNELKEILERSRKK